MRHETMTRWAGAVALAILAAGPAAAQWSGPDDAGQPLRAADTVPGANTFTPPPCTTPIFNDVPCSNYFSAWINQLYYDRVSTGCPYPDFCPDQYVTRGQMAAFLERAMRGTAYWTPGDAGNDNTAVGEYALSLDTTGPHNTAVGGYSLHFNSTGISNTAVGYGALESNTMASRNTAVGDSALTTQSYDPGTAVFSSSNTAVGFYALYLNQPDGGNAGLNGTQNTAVGDGALSGNTTGYRDTAVGYEAGARLDQVTTWTGGTVNLVANTTGAYNTFIGMAGATTQVNNCTAVGQDAYCDATNQVRLGNYFVTSIGGKVSWSALSDARAKTDIADLDLGLDLVMALRPVSYRLKGGNGRIDLGFVAQDVEAVLGDAYNVVDVGGDAERTLSLRYTDLIAPLVKAVQEQQGTIESQQREIERLHAQQSVITTQQKQLDRQRADLAALKAQVATLLAARNGAAGDTSR